ncbi:MAG: OB-fold nucleic acid binding domain-containing protein, partial [Candidatus Saccharibacteria bacterium]|nr:OB-fold nucleic acid binding domain-containing protein [Candidatus Saccharibacteria bacterium]
LMGIYLSAHPLDKYDTYFEEQTHPYELIKAENDNKIVTIGGIITAVRTILTKKGDKMAFIKMENKSTETEFIVFPSVFAEHGAKLVVDNVVRVQGKVNGTDKEGRPSSEVKVLAETVELVSDEVLESYRSTGTKLAAPISAPNKFGRRSGNKSSAERVYNGKGGGFESSGIQNEIRKVYIPPLRDPRKEKLYILIEDPEDTETLSAVRRLADINLGFQEVILVIRDGETKRPLRMPFKVDVTDELLKNLRELLGEDKVKVK